MAKHKKYFYEDNAQELDRIIHSKEISRRLKLVFEDVLKNENLKGKTFLDVGCGLGQFSQWAHKRGAKVTATDLGENLLTLTRQRVPVKTVIGDLKKLPFKDNTFDYVLCTEVVEHTENPTRAVKEILRVAKPKGRVLITTPNRVWFFAFWLLNFLGLRKYKGVENWIYPRDLRDAFNRWGGVAITGRGFNLFYPSILKHIEDKTRIFDNIMINYLIFGEKRSKD